MNKEQQELFDQSKEIRERLFLQFCIPCYLSLEQRIQFFQEKETDKKIQKHLITQSLKSELSLIELVPENNDALYKIVEIGLNEIKNLINKELYFININY